MTKSEAIAKGFRDTYQIAFSEQFYELVKLLEEDRFEEAKAIAMKRCNGDCLYWFKKGETAVAVEDE